MVPSAPGIELPERIARLAELTYNLWWSWHPDGRKLFRKLDYALWKAGGHNPVKILREIPPERLRAASTDPHFLALYDSVMASFDADMNADATWFTSKHKGRLAGPIAYFSAEFAIHSSLPLYAGGLGILAGDICKEASDLGLPMVGVGLMYPQGYFRQRISPDGWQEEIYSRLDFDKAPVLPVFSSDGDRILASIQLGNRLLLLTVWQVRVGATTLYLIDTNVEDNSPHDRDLSARLYIADREVRIQQEIVLGVGGVRILRALGIEPSIWHANEGHTAFMMLERIKEKVARGMAFEDALAEVRSTTVFTTHTPVPAGHDVFSIDLVDKYLSDYYGQLGVDRDAVLRLGRAHHDDGGFNMTALALATSGRCNAVSQLHGQVARRMWQGYWPWAKNEEDVPIMHVTNGVHVPTWVSPEMDRLFQQYLAPDWVERHDDAKLWDRVADIPDEALWRVRHKLKMKLVSFILELAQRSWSSRTVEAQQVVAMGALLHPEVLTIGFVRRFAGYKRPALVFHDMDRLKRIVSDPWRPVQIVFAGKSHPADSPSKWSLHGVCACAADRDFQGKIAFVSDHDMHSAHYLVAGVDVWLNNPRRMQEACGTSGMKASLNGVPHLSVKDGWWHEAYNGSNGWSIGDGIQPSGPEDEDCVDAESLYSILEQEIVPLYYERDRNGVPHGWVRVVKEAIRSVVPVYCARRMLKDYTDKLYLPQASARASGHRHKPSID
ncbi:MAG: alpha-glucan family phosphorylase [Dehalococcoidia bacterium]|nr:alpha-glucan family phosphorylase [Dehalococcoidia bacterium]